MSRYEEQLEKQNEQLREALAAEQKLRDEESKALLTEIVMRCDNRQKIVVIKHKNPEDILDKSFLNFIIDIYEYFCLVNFRTVPSEYFYSKVKRIVKPALKNFSDGYEKQKQWKSSNVIRQDIKYKKKLITFIIGQVEATPFGKVTFMNDHTHVQPGP